jgi:23S rRNA pseudouridine1911/1915/1917 synthase
MDYRVTAAQAGQRLDVHVAQLLNTSRSQAKMLILTGRLKLDGQPAVPNKLIKQGQTIHYTPPHESATTARQAPELLVVYEDNDVVIIDKPAGLTVHPGAGAPDQAYVSDYAATRTLDDQLDRPGIVHRLDKNTSGLLMIARTAAARAYLQKALADRQVSKTYLALVTGRPNLTEAVIDLPLGRHPHLPLKQAVVPNGRPSTTRYRVKSVYEGYSLLEVWPLTGRTHQIRVHLAAIGHPIAGDTVYGSPQLPAGLGRQFLHATKLKLTGPHGQAIAVSSPLPLDLKSFLDMRY